MKIKKAEIPADSLTNNYLPANYTDVFSCEFNTEKKITPDDIQATFWTTRPKWVERLFKIRNSIVKIVGLKGDDPDPEIMKKCIHDNEDYGLLSVMGKSENETVIRLSDKHLDAYMSVYLEDVGCNKQLVSVITVVDIHNWLGYIYFYSICPFHKIVVKSMLKQAIKEMSKN